MSIWGALAGGLVGTLVLTTSLRAASEFGLTRMDIPFLLGTAFTENRVRAKAAGYTAHFTLGVSFALVYYGVFRAIGDSSWWLGALFGVVPGAFTGAAFVNILLPVVHPRMATPLTAADSAPLLEPPGFLLLNYGRMTPLVTLVAHAAYGAIIGEFVSLST